MLSLIVVVVSFPYGAFGNVMPSTTTELTPDFLNTSSHGQPQDENLSITSCYQEYEKDVLDMGESSCCPSWKLALCLINRAPPGQQQGNLTEYWYNLFQKAGDCSSLKVDGRGLAQCTQNHDTGTAVSFFMLAAVIILLICCMIRFTVWWWIGCEPEDQAGHTNQSWVPHVSHANQSKNESRGG